MKIYVKTAMGDTHIVDLESMAEIANIRDHLDQKGVSIPSDAHLMVTTEAFKPAYSQLGTQLPEPPKPTNADDLPPSTSEKILVASNSDEKLFLRDLYGNFWDQRLATGMGIDPPIPPYTLNYNRYWNRVEIQRVTGPQTYTHTSESTEGMSQTDSTTLSAELGVDAYGLSAKLSVAFEQSITISTSKTVSNSYQIEVPAGKVGIWILWQLIDEVVAVDASGAQIQYSGWVQFAQLGKFTLASTLAAQGTPNYAPDLTLFDQ